jgi:putative protease
VLASFVFAAVARISDVPVMNASSPKTARLPDRPDAQPPQARRPELLAPAGDWDAMRAAVANGADAVYFGLSNFNARHRATNFTLADLPRVVEYLHSHNTLGYVTFNTLIFSDELPEAAKFVRAIAESGVDAVIVQDLGLARLIARLAPGLHVHGSTQMTLTEPLGVDFVRQLGVKRVVLARELSVADVQKITTAVNMPVEVFVHGALCVSYSGQCLTSEAIGGRSANRGQCAQACRLPYDLIVDGERRDLGDKAYLLSPQDLAAYDMIDQLADAGVVSLKIEGRLKSAQYVAATTQTYRSAIDALGSGPFVLPRDRELELAQSFSRGFTHGFLDGVNHQRLVHARFPKSRGVKAGKVVRVTPRGVIVELEQPAGGGGPRGFAVDSELKPGDGVVFDEGHPEQDEQGGRIVALYDVERGRPRPQQAGRRNAGGDTRAPAARQVEICFDSGSVNLQAVSVGAIVWKTDDPAIRKRLASTYARERVARRVAIDADVSANVGECLTVSVSDDDGHVVSVVWDQPLQAAQKFPLTEALFREQFGRLGDSPFELRQVTGLEQGSRAMTPKSVLNELRRDAVAQLIALRDDTERRRIAEPDALDNLRAEVAEQAKAWSLQRPCPPTTETTTTVPTTIQSDANAQANLHVLVRTLDQLRATLAWAHPATGLKPATVYCDFEDIRKYKEAVAIAREAGVPIGLATVRIIKPGEEGLLRQVGGCEPDLVLVRNLAGLSFYAKHFPHLPLVADYSLNVANELTAGILAEQGVRRMVPSYDLNWQQMSAMIGRVSPHWFEAVVHQHMPMFHTEHCVFCHTLSTGTSYKDCGRPCDDHRVDLSDRVGVANPLIADVGCRNTVYNGQAQSGIEYMPKMRAMGIGHFRVEMLREQTDDVAPLLNRYADVMLGRTEAAAAVRSLRVLNQLGVTAGTFGRD